MARGPRKKPLDFGGDPNHVTLDLGLGYRVMVTVREGPHETGYGVYLTVIVLVLAEVCALLSVILVFLCWLVIFHAK